MSKKKKIFLSFVGTNDAGKLIQKEDGAILTALKYRKFDEVILLWNESSDFDFKKVVEYLEKEIVKRKYSKKVQNVLLKINDVVDHNEIYTVLKSFCDSLPKDEWKKYTASISSGTPAMQVCWILLAESGDFSKEFPLELIYVRNPKFKTDIIRTVKLDTSLPRIIKLENEVASLKNELLPDLKLYISKGQVYIGSEEIPLSPIEFSYYRYFAEEKLKGNEKIKFSGLLVPIDFVKEIYKYHIESFPDLELNRMDLKTLIGKNQPLSITTFRGNVSRINKKVKSILNSEMLSKYYEISIEGKRGARFYGIKLDKQKIKLIK